MFAIQIVKIIASIVAVIQDLIHYAREVTNSPLQEPRGFI